MADPFAGEIRMFAGNFAPNNWAFCDGSLLSIAQYDTLFTLIGTTYGGDGQSTFALPDLRGRVPIHQGTPPGLGQSFTLGQLAGQEEVVLTVQQLPLHTHQMRASSGAGAGPDPAGQVLAESTTATIYAAANPTTSLAPQAVSFTGGSQPHENMQPFLGLSFIIALNGIFPSQN